MKHIIVRLSVAFQRGRMYIQMLTFLGVAEVVKSTKGWPDWVYWILIPGMIVFCIGVGLLDMRFILREEIKQRNPIQSEILDIVTELKRKS